MDASEDPRGVSENGAPQLPPRAGRAIADVGAWLRRMPRWQQGLLAASVLAVAVGGALMLAADPPPTVASGGGTDFGGAGGAGLVPGGPSTPSGAPQQAASEPAARGVFRLGFSFLAGFSVGAFVRAAVKVAAVAVGFFLVMLVLLEYAGFVAIDWHAIDDSWGRFWAQVGEEWGDFQRFLTGRLPAVGLAGLGLWAGFRRR